MPRHSADPGRSDVRCLRQVSVAHGSAFQYGGKGLAKCAHGLTHKANPLIPQPVFLDIAGYRRQSSPVAIEVLDVGCGSGSREAGSE